MKWVFGEGVTDHENGESAEKDNATGAKEGKLENRK